MIKLPNQDNSILGQKQGLGSNIMSGAGSNNIETQGIKPIETNGILSGLNQTTQDIDRQTISLENLNTLPKEIPSFNITGKPKQVETIPTEQIKKEYDFQKMVIFRDKRSKKGKTMEEIKGAIEKGKGLGRFDVEEIKGPEDFQIEGLITKKQKLDPELNIEQFKEEIKTKGFETVYEETDQLEKSKEIDPELNTRNEMLGAIQGGDMSAVDKWLTHQSKWAEYEEGDDWGDVGKDAIINLLPSAFNLAKGGGYVLKNPIDTFGSLLNLGGGVLGKADRMLGEGMAGLEKLTTFGDWEESESYKGFRKEGLLGIGGDDTEQAQMVNMMGGYLKTRYGTKEGFKQAMGEDPAGILSDILAITSGGSAIAVKLLKNAGIKASWVNKLGKFAKVTAKLDAMSPDALVISKGTKILGKGLSTILHPKETLNQISGTLEKWAKENVVDALNPTKEKFKKMTDNVSKKFAEKGIKGSVKEMLNETSTKVDEFGDKIKDYENSGKITGTTKKVDLLEIVEKYKDKSLVAGVDITPEVTNKIKQLEKTIKKLPDDVLNSEAIIIKRVYDDQIYNRKGMLVVGDLPEVQQVKNSIANDIRNKIGESNPELAKLNEEFAFYKNANDILDATALRKTGQRGGLINKIGGLMAGGGALAYGGIPALGQAVALGYIAKKTIDFFQSPGLKTNLAKWESKLSKLLKSGDDAGVQKIVKEINDEVKVIKETQKALPYKKGPRTIVDTSKPQIIEPSGMIHKRDKGIVELGTKQPTGKKSDLGLKGKTSIPKNAKQINVNDIKKGDITNKGTITAISYPKGVKKIHLDGSHQGVFPDEVGGVYRNIQSEIKTPKTTIKPTKVSQKVDDFDSLIKEPVKKTEGSVEIAKTQQSKYVLRDTLEEIGLKELPDEIGDIKKLKTIINMNTGEKTRNRLVKELQDKYIKTPKSAIKTPETKTPKKTIKIDKRNKILNKLKELELKSLDVSKDRGASAGSLNKKLQSIKFNEDKIINKLGETDSINIKNNNISYSQRTYNGPTEQASFDVFIDGKNVGTIFKVDTKDGIYIKNLIIDEQKQGFGTKIFNDLAKKYGKIEGDAVPTSIPFWKKQGVKFTGKKTQHGYENFTYTKQPIKTQKVLDIIGKQNKTPETIKVWIKSKFSNKGHYKDVPIIKKVDNIKLYQGGKLDDNRQFWTTNKKYASQFGDIKEKTGNFYQIDNGNRVIEVYVDATKSPIKTPKGLDKVTDSTKVKKSIFTPKRAAIGTDTPDYVLKNRELAKNMGEKTTDLATEARKYKSADEFVKGLEKNENIVMHGTTATFDKFNINTEKRLGHKLGDGSYFTKSKKLAENLSKGNGNIYYVDIGKKKIFDLKKDMHKTTSDYKIVFDVPKDVLDTAKKYNINSSKEFNQLKELKLRNKIIKEAGYDGVKNSDVDILIFNPSDLKPKTKSQLKEIYNKANTSIKTPKSILTPKRAAVGQGTPDRVLKNRELAKKMSQGIVDDTTDKALIKQISKFKDGEHLYNEAGSIIRKELKKKGLRYKREYVEYYDKNVSSNKNIGKLTIDNITIKKVKPKSRVLYHGTSSENINKIKTEGFKKGSELSKGDFRGGGHDAIQDSISLSYNPRIASSFTGQSPKGGLITIKIKDNANIVKISEFTDDYAEALNDLIPELKKKGIDAIDIGGEEELLVLNKNIIEIKDTREFTVINTNKELKDIYNKANKKIKTPKTMDIKINRPVAVLKTTDNQLIKEAKKLGFKTKGEKIVLYRGYNKTNTKKIGNYFSGDKDYALNFSDFGEDTLRKIEISPNDIYKPKILPEAVNEAQLTKAINEAKKGGFKAVYVEEGGSDTPSVFFIEKQKVGKVNKKIKTPK